MSNFKKCLCVFCKFPCIKISSVVVRKTKLEIRATWAHLSLTLILPSFLRSEIILKSSNTVFRVHTGIQGPPNYVVVQSVLRLSNYAWYLSGLNFSIFWPWYSLVLGPDRTPWSRILVRGFMSHQHVSSTGNEYKNSTFKIESLSFCFR